MQQQWSVLAAAILVAGTFGACADRGEMSSAADGNQPAATAPAGNQDNRTRVTVTGCFQDMSGPSNYVLSNVGDASGVAPAATRSYRIEQSGEFEQYIGKKVNVAGWVDADDAAKGMAAGRAANEQDFNDLPELHVDSITATSEACGGQP